MIVVGLTGNYGMGKSTVATMFRELGAMTIDTDEIVRDLLDEPVIIREIRKTFGDDVIHGNAIDKKRLADTVFQQPHLRISLEDILHPEVFKRVGAEISRISPAQAPSVVVVQAPVLIERGYQNRFDKIITVFTPEEVAVQRLREKGVSEEAARERLRSQLPVEMKIRGSDFSIDNGEDLEHTRRQVEAVYQKLRWVERGHGHN